ncbi:Oidioi.mRNA.OKI2018_I69.XSR.g16942.t1.cds [Oikopleura dioica]|uniref:Oidioi.mRNA.OKI2018_I69.XSR.g16942.t1.cds n=1 Tax=Oikopleura dioica TaxID=34765 RepID=A0ABN7SHN6_OIKDI|nr:Oidioi.mRNA.OKI2018_I69.XSR.g16942.t1.cds [Oikopleura dioica]
MENSLSKETSVEKEDSVIYNPLFSYRGISLIGCFFQRRIPRLSGRVYTGGESACLFYDLSEVKFAFSQTSPVQSHSLLSLFFPDKIKKIAPEPQVERQRRNKTKKNGEFRTRECEDDPLLGDLENKVDYLTRKLTRLSRMRATSSGRQGLGGQRGPAGAPGRDGASGRHGDSGAKGEKGMPGQRGDRGPKGFAGKDGEPGPAGAKGNPGFPGREGRDGDYGDRGVKGPIGQKGYVGRKGEKGYPGDDGTDGKIGPPGLEGAPGRDGLPGQHFSEPEFFVQGTNFNE